MFLNLPGSCGQNKNQSIQKTNYWSIVSDFLPEWLDLAVKSFEDNNQIHIFSTFKKILTVTTIKNQRQHFNIIFFSFSFHFLLQEPWMSRNIFDCLLIFELLFLVLFINILAGVRPRYTINYLIQCNSVPMTGPLHALFYHSRCCLTYRFDWHLPWIHCEWNLFYFEKLNPDWPIISFCIGLYLFPGPFQTLWAN